MKYYGLIGVVLGALVLVISYMSDKYLDSGATDINWIQGLGFLLIVAGFITHIVINKKRD